MNIPGNKSIVLASLLALNALIWIAPPDHISTISDAILAITAIIVLWYTLETSMMRKEMAKQNVILTRPIIVLELSDGKVFYRNNGKGPAINIHVLKFKVDSLNEAKKFEGNANKSSYEMPIVSYIPQDAQEEMKIFKQNASKGTKGTISEPDIFFELAKITQTAIEYNDIEGTRYQTQIETQSGIVKEISFQRGLGVKSFLLTKT